MSMSARARVVCGVLLFFILGLVYLYVSKATFIDMTKSPNFNSDMKYSTANKEDGNPRFTARKGHKNNYDIKNIGSINPKEYTSKQFTIDAAYKEPNNIDSVNDDTANYSTKNSSANKDSAKNSSANNGSAGWGYDKRHLLLVATHRGGSTFLAEMFRWNPDCFIWMEPLQFTPRNQKQPHNMLDELYHPSGDTWGQDLEDFVRTRVDVLSALLQCHMDALPSDIVDDIIRRALRVSIKFKSTESMGVEFIREMCTNATIVASKTIRFPACNITTSLDADPLLKVIYSRRDPRGIVGSRWMLNIYRQNVTKAIQAGINECQKFEIETSIIKNIAPKYPGRILMVKYEELALKPVQTAGKMYQFIGYPMPVTVTQWIAKNTQTSGRNRSYHTQRNSSSRVAQWRQNLPSDVINGITIGCGDTLRHLGYPTR